MKRQLVNKKEEVLEQLVQAFVLIFATEECSRIAVTKVYKLL